MGSLLSVASKMRHPANRAAAIRDLEVAPDRWMAADAATGGSGPRLSALRVPAGMTRVLGMTGALVLFLAPVARAADSGEADKLREQLRSTVLQLRECQDQQAAAKSATACPAPGAGSAAAASSDAALKARLAATQRRLAAAQRAAAQTASDKSALEKAASDYAALKASADQTAAELEKAKTAFAKADDAGRAAAAERDRLKVELATQTRVAETCQAKNERLTAVAQRLLNAYDHVSFGERLLAREPVTGFGKVRRETIAQAREDEIRAERCDPRLDALPPKPTQTAGQP